MKVTRDEHSIPHISATTDHDAFFALGYIHAQERLWQMTHKRRLAEGRLSEVMGIDALPMDQYMRAYTLVPAAQSAMKHLDETALEVLRVYAAGVNAWISEGNTLPAEFYILDTEPEPWKPVDSILMMKLMSLNLGPNHSAETEFDLLVKEVGLAKANDIIPNENKNNPAATDYYEGELADSEVEARLIGLNDRLQDEFKSGGEIAVGSNAWAVSGKYTESNFPLLAGDPHLLTEMPSVWYLANIKGDRINVTGATFAGVPLVFMGRNESVSWGVTNMFPDALDLYVERTNPLNPNQYEVDGEWVDMEIEEQTIHIKSASPAFLNKPVPSVQWQVRRTRNGPLISDAIGQVDSPLAIRWTPLDEVDKSFESFLGMNYADNLESFESALREYKAPAVNIIYADVENNIAQFAAGKIPVRKKGNGRRPVPGWNSNYQWERYLSFDEMPHKINPEEGYVINANNKNHPDDYPHIILNLESPPYRADRIEDVVQEFIASGKKISVQDFIDLQGDSESLQVKELLPHILSLPVKNAKHKAAIEKLKAWDHVIAGDSEASALYQVWMKHFNQLLISDDLKGSALHERRGNAIQTVPPRLRPLLIKQVFLKSPDLNNDWCDQVNTDVHETCDDLGLIALDATLEELDRLIGMTHDWEDINELYLPHLAFRDIPLLDSIFSRTIEGNSDRFSVNRADWRYSEAVGYRVISTAGYRQVIDLSPENNSGYINSSGQSEHLLSDHYDDNITPFKDLQLRPLRLGAPSRSQAELILHLEPVK
ncbi:penicillin acylase family protein [Pseudoalteromonas luteoviolacea]|uniref:penicillin acylase family protein n=1 Tax=Pseudoalteromonas luteoviolacea TaxID=43657 RepID=UPI0018C8667F|nr:penicillin acylase family protein [Pseudoalteromonas luteoviolacea]